MNKNDHMIMLKFKCLIPPTFKPWTCNKPKSYKYNSSVNRAQGSDYTRRSLECFTARIKPQNIITHWSFHLHTKPIILMKSVN